MNKINIELTKDNMECRDSTANIMYDKDKPGKQRDRLEHKAY